MSCNVCNIHDFSVYALLYQSFFDRNEFLKFLRRLKEVSSMVFNSCHVVILSLFIFQETISPSCIAISSFIYAGSQFIQVLWISRYYGAESLAIFALITGFFAPLTSFLSSGQRFSMLAKGTASSHDIIDNVVLRVILIGIVLVIISVYSFVYEPRMLFLVIFLGFYKLLDALLEVFLWFRQLKLDAYGYVLVGFLRSIVVPIACSLVYLFNFDIYAYFFISAILNFCVFMFLYINYLRLLKITTNLSFNSVLVALISASVPGAASGLESFAVTFPRFFLAYNGNLKVIGVYTIFIQIISVLGMVASAIIQSDIPKFSSNAIDVRVLYIDFLKLLLLFNILFMLFIYLLPYNFYGYVFGRWFITYADILVFLPLFVVFGYGGSYAITMLAVRYGSFYLLWYSLGLLCGIFVLSIFSYFIVDYDLTVVLCCLLLSYIVRWAIVSNLVKSITI